MDIPGCHQEGLQAQDPAGFWEVPYLPGGSCAAARLGVTAADLPGEPQGRARTA